MRMEQRDFFSSSTASICAQANLARCAEDRFAEQFSQVEERISVHTAKGESSAEYGFVKLISGAIPKIRIFSQA